MARIRSIKPEFWASEQVVACSRDARLLFIGLWNFCDDGGRLQYKPLQIKMQVFPGDPITPNEVQGWLDELASNDLIVVYEVAGKRYLQVTGWKRHQRVDKPTYRHPKPDNARILKEKDSPNALRGVDEGDENTTGGIDEDSASPRPRSGVEWSGVENKDNTLTTFGCSSERENEDEEKKPPPCPKQKIRDLYHQILPECPRCESMNALERDLVTRWREEPAHQNLEFWEWYFNRCRETFWFTDAARKTPGLQTMVRKKNFYAVINGEYDAA